MAIDFSCILIWFLESWDHVKPSSKITLARSRKDDWNQSQNLGTIRYPDRRFRSRGAGKLMLVVLDVLEINQISVSRLRMNDVITAEPSNYTPPLSLFELLSTGGIKNLVARYLKLHNPVTCTARRRRGIFGTDHLFLNFPFEISVPCTFDSQIDQKSNLRMSSNLLKIQIPRISYQGGGYSCSVSRWYHQFLVQFTLHCSQYRLKDIWFISWISSNQRILVLLDLVETSRISKF